MAERRPQLSPPRLNVLPATIVSAELQRGTVVRCGPGVRGVGWPETARVRAAVIQHLLPKPELVAVLTTAAWIWGGTWQDQTPLTLSTLNAKRFLGVPGLNCRVHEFNICVDETVAMEGVLVTSPLRTIYDMLFLPESEFSDTHLTLCTALRARYAAETADVLLFLRSYRRPYITRAVARLCAADEVRVTR